jgi:methylated-DNA-[protein]-cysteine S-methyltransferase
MKLETGVVQTPLGKLGVVVSPAGLCFVAFPEERRGLRNHVRRYFGDVEWGRGAGPIEVLRCLKRYFAGDLGALDGMPIDLHGTAFQRQVSEALRAIPPGQTQTYLELARAIGRPRTPRAVGTAAGANPVPIVVPCHRLLGATGLSRYRGGIGRQVWLLRHEGASVAGTRGRGSLNDGKHA